MEVTGTPQSILLQTVKVDGSHILYIILNRVKVI